MITKKEKKLVCFCDGLLLLYCFYNSTTEWQLLTFFNLLAAQLNELSCRASDRGAVLNMGRNKQTKR